ncbi:hypothetical protein RA263_27830, partial [Pseudomonas syringae pv. tagetis]
WFLVLFFFLFVLGFVFVFVFFCFWDCCFIFFVFVVGFGDWFGWFFFVGGVGVLCGFCVLWFGGGGCGVVSLGVGLGVRCVVCPVCV